jgi:hypothetical protein
VEVPPADSIDEAVDINVIQLSAGENKTIPIKATVRTLAFLANCDGADYVSLDQPLEAILFYQTGAEDTLVFSNIHPGERANNILTGPYAIYSNEVFGCGPFYYDVPQGWTDSHSEFWHWYIVYPDEATVLDSILFTGLQSGDPNTEIYISALSYSGEPVCDCIVGDANDDGSINIGDEVYIENIIFRPGSPAPKPYPICSGDANFDCAVNIGDAVFIGNIVFRPGSPLPPSCIEWIADPPAGCGLPLRK